MDTAYNQHSDRARRKNRSFTNINHLTLAPLTARLPIEDDDISDPSLGPQSVSYLQGKSAPTTPRLLTHSPAGPRSQSRTRAHRRTGSAPGTHINKSKSAVHIGGKNSRSQSGLMTPRRKKDDSLERVDSDWLLRAGAVMSNEAREFKGQNWLVSRQSSTSLAGIRGTEEEAFEAELAREREYASRRGSRRGSVAADSDNSPAGSRYASRAGSRSQSMAAGSRSVLMSPNEKHHGEDSYFPEQEDADGPDFVNLDSRLEELEQDTEQDDEAMVRRLVRKGQNGKGSWISNVVGTLFAVDENEEDSDDDEEDEEGSEEVGAGRSSWSARHFEGVSNVPEERIPPPKTDEGVWQDAAWLLSVATKVIL